MLLILDLLNIFITGKCLQVTVVNRDCINKTGLIQNEEVVFLPFEDVLCAVLPHEIIVRSRVAPLHNGPFCQGVENVSENGEFNALLFGKAE